MTKRLTQYILIALVLGIVAGYVVHSSFPASAEAFATRVELLPFAFLRLIKMIIAPLVFSTLVVGIAKMGDIGTQPLQRAPACRARHSRSRDSSSISSRPAWPTR
jgi:Na+/H+-dicarboxylate symporter